MSDKALVQRNKAPTLAIKSKNKIPMETLGVGLVNKETRTQWH